MNIITEMNQCTNTSKGCLRFCYNNMIALFHTEFTLDCNSKKFRVGVFVMSQATLSILNMNFGGNPSTRLCVYTWTCIDISTMRQIFLRKHFHPFTSLQNSIIMETPWFQEQVLMTLFALMQPVLHLVPINHQKEVLVQSILHI